MFSLILEVRGAHGQVHSELGRRSGTADDRVRKLNEVYRRFGTKLRELKSYYRMNGIWLSPELCDHIESVIELFDKQDQDLLFVVFNREVDAIFSQEDKETLQQQYDAEQRQIAGWINQEANPAIRE